MAYDPANTAKFYERQLIQKLISVNRETSLIFARFIRRVSPIIQQYRYRDTVIIRDPDIENAIRSEITRFGDEFTQYTELSKTQAWQLSENKNNETIQKWLKSLSVATIPEVGEYLRNTQAMDAFMKRKISGMNLSDRVWKMGQNIRDQLEYYVESGLAAGRSAEKISSDIRQVLNEPEKRFRRVRDAKGKLVPSKPMEQYHPGRGVYRSSYQNARRLARTEINMAYRQSDMNFFRMKEQVLGYEVRLSAAHPETDICDAAAGRYPKEFNFIGWHPACLCFVIPILMTDDQFEAWANGEPVSVQYESDIPESMKKYLIDNRERMEGWKTKPYFLEQNRNFVNKIYSKNDEVMKKEVPQMFSHLNTKLNEKVLYRGDIRDKGETFSEAVNTKDYIIDGNEKNKAGFHWFTDSKSYAEMYAKEQMSQYRGQIQASILTEIETKNLNVFDMTKMSLEDQVNFNKSLYNFGIKDQIYRQERLLDFTGRIDEKNLDKLLGYKTFGKIVQPGQIYSDGELGVKFKKWLAENGFDGYKFKMFKFGDEYGFISASKFKVKKRIKV